MAKFKNIRIKMKGGKSRLQRVQVLASGKYKFVKNISRSRKVTRKTKRKTSKKRSVRRIARKRKRSARKFTLPIAVVGGLVAGLTSEPHSVVGAAMAGDFELALRRLALVYTGLRTDGVWDPNELKRGLLPLIVGGAVHKFVGGPPLNMNRMLASAGIPFLRI